MGRDRTCTGSARIARAVASAAAILFSAPAPRYGAQCVPNTLKATIVTSPQNHGRKPSKGKRAAAWVAVFIWGAIAALAVCITPFEFLVLPLAGAYVSIRAIGPVRRRWMWALLVFFGGLVGLARLPLGALERKVAPIRIEADSVGEAWVALKSQRELYGSVHPDLRAELEKSRQVVFETKSRMSKRDITEKFASENRMLFHVWYCGTGSSLLSGPHPIVELLPTPSGDEENRPLPRDIKNQ